MKADWLRIARSTGLPLFVLFFGCGTDHGEQSGISQAAVTECPHAAIALGTTQGRRTAALAKPMTVPVPATIPIAGGAANLTATITYSLSADKNQPLVCRYKRAGNDLKLDNCDRDVDATTWLEASAMDIVLSDPKATAALSVCPIGPVTDPAALLPGPNDQQVRGEQLVGGREVFSDRIAGALRIEDISVYVAAARADRRVASLLGERSAFIDTIAVDGSKKATSEPHHLKLIFYSYSNSQTVEVVVNRGTVQSAQRIVMWPPEGQEEISQAIALAKLDPRLAGRVNDLQAGGMLFQPTENTSYLTHRVMGIHFGDATLTARYFATVDLTDLVVQAAGPVQ
jgi:hypothetical protein